TIVPGSQPVPAVHAPKSPNSPQTQAAEHVRVRVCVSPQLPQLVCCDSVASGAHSPWPSHVHASQLQSERHTRRSEPQLPQAAPFSIEPAAHSPPPVHAPASSHVPLVQRCICVPQLPHGWVRVSPSV